MKVLNNFNNKEQAKLFEFDSYISASINKIDLINLNEIKSIFLNEIYHMFKILSNSI